MLPLNTKDAKMEPLTYPSLVNFRVREVGHMELPKGIEPLTPSYEGGMLPLYQGSKARCFSAKA